MNIEEVEGAETMQRQALEIREPGEDFDPNAKPQNGEQYLTHMLYERRKEPAVVVRPLGDVTEKPVSSSVLPDDAVFKLLSEQSEMIEKFKQTDEWKNSIEAEFKKVRDHFQIARSLALERNVVEELHTPRTNDPNEWIEFCQNTNPLVNVLVRWNQKTLERLILFLYEWLREQCENAEDDVDIAAVPIHGSGKTDDENLDNAREADAKANENAVKNSKQQADVPETIAPDDEDMEIVIGDNDDMDGAAALPPVSHMPKLKGKVLDLQVVDVWFGLWLYAVLIAIDMRLDSDTLATIRQIARLLIFCRCHISSLDEEEAQPHNMLIYLIAKLFGQLDFLAFI